MTGLSLDQWCCICLSTCCWWGSNGLLRGGWTRFSSAMAFPGSTFSILVFLYLCLSVVAGLEGLSHRVHEARAFWHWFHFFGPFSRSLSLSLPPSYWFHRGGRLGSWGEIRQNSLNSNYDITLSRGGWARFPPLWSNFWSSFTCVCRLLLGWRGCSISSMKKELFDIVFTSSVVFTISYWFHLGGRAGSSGEVRQVSSAMVLLFLLHVLVCCCSGGRVVP